MTRRLMRRADETEEIGSVETYFNLTSVSEPVLALLEGALPKIPDETETYVSWLLLTRPFKFVADDTWSSFPEKFKFFSTRASRESVRPENVL